MFGNFLFQKSQKSAFGAQKQWSNLQVVIDDPVQSEPQLQQDQLNVLAVQAVPDPICLGLDELDHPVTMARYLNLAGFIS